MPTALCLPIWVEDLTTALISNPKLVAVSGSSYIIDGTGITNWTMKVGMPISLRLYRFLVGHYMLTGGNFAIRRQVYKAAGGFDAHHDMLDDVDLAFRVSRIGRIGYLKQPKVQTEGDSFRHGYLKGFWHYARHLPSLLAHYWFGRKSPRLHTTCRRRFLIITAYHQLALPRLSNIGYSKNGQAHRQSHPF